MLDFGWSEFFLCLVVAVFAIGPKQIPEVLYWVGKVVRRIQYLKFAVTNQLDDLMNVAEVEKLRKQASLKSDVSPRIQDDIDDESYFDADMHAQQELTPELADPVDPDVKHQ